MATTARAPNAPSGGRIMARPMLTTPQAAAVLGVSPATLRTWRARGQGPRFKQPGGPGSSAVYAPEVVELYKLQRPLKRGVANTSGA